MTLINRFVRLFRADMHAVLDSIEEPALLIKQALRDMEDSVAREQRLYEELQATRTQLHASKAECELTLVACERELDVCMTAEQDDLARGVLKRRLETEHWLRILANKQQANEVALSASLARLDEWKAQLASIRQKADLFTEDVADRGTVTPGPALTVSSQDIEIALLSAKERRRAR
jgi:phage shock protein A